MDCARAVGHPRSMCRPGVGLRLRVTLACLVLTAVLSCGSVSNLRASSTPTARIAAAQPQALPTATTAVPAPVAGLTQAPSQLLPDLVIKYVSIELETGGACSFGSTQLGTRILVKNIGPADAGPFVVQANGSQQAVQDGLASGQTLSLWLPGYAHATETAVTVDVTAQVEEDNETNNTFLQMVPIPTLPATCTPSPTEYEQGSTPSPTPLPSPAPSATPSPSPAPSPAVAVHTGQVTISTYPYANFTSEAWSETFHMPYSVLDRAAYQASNPLPVDVVYSTLVMENEYLRLTFLPDLGGRLYEVIFKPTGHRETYRNLVLKPSPWGPVEQGWWLAAGGFEWCLPVGEHGYEWGVPWTAKVSREASGATVTLVNTTATDRVRAEIAVGLEAGVGYFTIRPRLVNPTGAPMSVKYWTNALLAPGGRNMPSADLRFVLPDVVTSVTVHSTGDESLPGYGQRMPWPVVNGRDLSRLGNWTAWLGVFEDPAAGDFAAVYDEGYDEGMVRVSPAAEVHGVKVFGFGWTQPIPSGNWTDDGSSYVELHGGPAPTFDDSIILSPGGRLEWTEAWYPVSGLGGLRYANSVAALNLSAAGGRAQVAVAVARPWSGSVMLLLDGQERWRSEATLKPGQELNSSVLLDPDVPQMGQLTLRLLSGDGTTAAEYSAYLRLK